MNTLLAAVAGAIIAVLLDRYVATRLRGAYLTKRLARSMIEELLAVDFTTDPMNPPPRFGGFSSQTFDSFFAQLAESMPQRYLTPLMRYHWRMKWLDELQKESRAAASLLSVPPSYITQLEKRRDSLVTAMNECAALDILDLAFWPSKQGQQQDETTQS